MSYTSDIWLHPLQDWCKMVDEMSDFMSTGQMGNFIFRPVYVAVMRSVQCFYTLELVNMWYLLNLGAKCTLVTSVIV